MEAFIKEKAMLIASMCPALPRKESRDRFKEAAHSELLLYRADYVYDPLTERRKKMCRVRCTYCRDEYYLEYTKGENDPVESWGDKVFGFIDPATGEPKKSYSNCQCFSCGTNCKAMHIGQFSRRYKMCSGYVGEVHNIKGSLAVLAWWVTKECDKEGAVVYHYHLNEGVLIIDGKPVRINGYDTSFFGTTSWDTNWHVKATYSAQFGRWTYEEFYGDILEGLVGTCAENCALDVFLRDCEEAAQVGAYLQIWCKVPQIENLVRSGYSNFVNKMIEAMSHSSGYYSPTRFYVGTLSCYIDTKKAKPHEMLRVEKCKVKELLKSPIEYIAFRGYMFAKGFTVTTEQLKRFQSLGFANFQYLFSSDNYKLLTPERTLNYLERERERYAKRHKNFNNLISPTYFKDYLDMTRQLYGNIPPELLYPKNLEEAHNRANQLIKEKESAELTAKIQKRCEKLLWLSFADNELGLEIFPCPTHGELIKEGEQLSHCVASYAKRYANGDTIILFIRKSDELDKPYFTLEYNEKNMYVVQNRGRKNCDRTPQVREFEKRWLNYIKETKENKNGKQSREKTELRAGA